MYEAFVEFLNAPNLGMIECLIVWSVRHEHHRIRLCGDVFAVLVTVVDKDSDI
jgi:hypothetical protein